MTSSSRPSLKAAAHYAPITKNCFVNLPFERLAGYLDLLLEYRIQPEIGLAGEVLYDTPTREFEAAAAALRQAGLSCTLHAPFFDLAPGALDRRIRRVTREKLGLAFALLPVFKPRAIVCHLGYEDNKHGYKQEEWFGHALETWQQLLEIAEENRVIMTLENTYEAGPKQHQRMLTALDSPYARFCFDVGHTLAFAGNHWQDWLPTLSPWLGQLHLHDNHGGRDEHLAPGQGCFDFAGFFAYLRQQRLQPLITLEPHSEEALWQSLAALDRMGIFAAHPG